MGSKWKPGQKARGWKPSRLSGKKKGGRKRPPPFGRRGDYPAED